MCSLLCLSGHTHVRTQAHTHTYKHTHTLMNDYINFTIMATVDNLIVLELLQRSYYHYICLYNDTGNDVL